MARIQRLTGADRGARWVAFLIGSAAVLAGCTGGTSASSQTHGTSAAVLATSSSSQKTRPSETIPTDSIEVRSPSPTPATRSASPTKFPRITYFTRGLAGNATYRVTKFMAPGDHYYILSHCARPNGEMVVVGITGLREAPVRDCSEVQDLYTTVYIEKGAVQKLQIRAQNLGAGSWIQIFYQRDGVSYRFGTRAPSPAASSPQEVAVSGP